MTNLRAKQIIDSYASDAPSAGAVERLVRHDESEFARLLNGQPGAGEEQDQLDAIIYT